MVASITTTAACERGDHPDTELNPDGLPVCVDCASLVVVPLSPPCACERGPVAVLLGYDACCVRCAAEILDLDTPRWIEVPA